MAGDAAPASVIAIDGPAASGKSTMAQGLAARFGYLYLDTGVMYRAVALAAIRRGVPAEEAEGVVRIAEQIEIDVRPPSVEDGRQYDVLLDGEDVTWDIRSPEVDDTVSQVSMYAGVRRAMTQRQREIGLRGNVVMAGRDIGTVVLPDADLKIYLDATVESRAHRRYQECLQRGEEPDYEEVLRSMQARDRLDSTRDLAPLKPAADAVVIETTALGVEEVLEQAFRLALDP